MGRKANKLLSNITTNSSPYNLNWENAKYACLDGKNLTHPPIPAEIMHDLQRWCEDELSIKRRIPEPIAAENTGSVDNKPHTNAGVKTKIALALEKERLNLRYKGIHHQTGQIMKKKIKQVARKTQNYLNKQQNYRLENSNLQTTYGVGPNKRKTTMVFKKQWFCIRT